ncbi:MAG: glycosyl hydrolase family 18 protein [Thermomicrobiales bacterium]
MNHFRLPGGHRRFRTSLVVAALVALSLILPNAHLLVPQAQPVAAAPIIRWAYYVTYAKDSFAALQANAGALTMVSPYYFTLQADGTIKNGEEPDTNALLRAARVKIIPMVKNAATNADFTAQIATPEARDKLAATIADLVVPRNYDGINVDFEDIRPEDRPLLTDTMARIAAKIRPSGKLVTQAIVGKTKDTTGGYGGAFDYAALAPSVDLAILMAYDYHYAGGNAGPVAPIGWVRDVATYAAQTFGAGKVLLGMPLYGYDWDLTSGGSAKAVTYAQALDRAKRPGATRTIDLASQSEVVRYADDAGDRHEVWFESAATFDAKFSVVRQAGIAGFGLWRIGQEDSGIWDVLKRSDQPAARAAPVGADNASRRYFTETGHNLQNGFKQFWDANGGIAQFGYPLTEEFTERNPADDRMYTVQYFERARFEWHADTSSVALGRIGQEAFNANNKPGGIGLDPPPNLTPDKRYFPETRHVLAGSFKQYWEMYNGKTFLGLPLGEETTEQGKTVQYFEYGRLEYNPAGTTVRERVQIGLVGTDLLRTRGWVP